MDSDSFEALVASLEVKQRNWPRLFLARTAALACLGFGYLLLVLSIALALTVGLLLLVIAHPNALTIKIAIALGLVAGGLAIAILRGLYVRITPPEGIELTAHNAPKLMHLVGDLRQRIGSSRFHRILLNGAYNASVYQVPRLGVFGWHRNYLMLGLPLLQSMQPREFEAVLAHEFAHLAGGHGRFGNWLYRLRRSWEQLFSHLAHQGTSGTKVLTSFLEWFWPRFNAHAFVLSRAQEYEADALAAKIVGGTEMAWSLMRIAVYDRHLDEAFWEKVFRRANHEPEPPARLFAELPQVLKQGPEPQEACKWMRQASLVNTTTTDTHPCLRERLQALEQLPAEDQRDELPPLTGLTAAEEFLGSQGDELATKLGTDWAENIRENWRARHQHTKELAAALQDEPRSDQEIDLQARIEALWKKAETLANLDGAKGALPIIHEILQMDSQHPGALYARGSSLLDNDDAAGIADVERSMELDSEWKEAGLKSLAGYYHRNGDKVSLKAVHKSFEELEVELQAAMKERSDVKLTDVLVPHQLSPGELDALTRLLASEKAVVAAWVAKKVTKLRPKVPMHAIAIEVKFPWWKFQADDATQELVQRLVDGVPCYGHVLVFVRERDLKALGKKVASVENSNIYRCKS